MLVQVGQRQAIDLGLGVPAELPPEVLHHDADDPTGDELEDSRRDVDPGNDEQDASEVAELDTLAGDEVGAGEHVGELILAFGSEQLDCFLLRCAGWELSHLAADHTVENNVGRVAQKLGPGHRQRNTDGRQDDDQRESHALGAEKVDRPLDRVLEVLRLFARRYALGAMSTAVHAAWEATISWYSVHVAISSACVP